MRRSVSPYRWKREPTSLEWDRFLYYSRRVKFLNTRVTNIKFLFSGAFFDRFTGVIRSRTSGDLTGEDRIPIFLRLETLQWEGHGETRWGSPEYVRIPQDECCLAIIREAPRLKSFVGTLHIQLWPAVLAEISKYNRHFHDLSIQQKHSSPPQDFSSLAGPLLELVRQKDMHELELPSTLMAVSDVQEYIFGAPNLKTLQIERSSFPSLGEDELGQATTTIPVDYPMINARSLPNLEVLDGDLASVRGLIGAATFLRLQDLYIMPLEMGEARVTWEYVRTFLDAVGSCCPNLETYHSSTQVVDSGDEDASETCILMRLKGCTCLSSLKLTLWCDRSSPVSTPSDFNPTDHDWIALAQSWSALTKLTYACHPKVIDNGFCRAFWPEPSASIKALGSILSNCPKMSSLNIPICVRRRDFDSPIPLVPRKPSLEELAVLQSWIEDDAIVETVAFLGSLLSSCCGLEVPYLEGEDPTVMDDLGDESDTDEDGQQGARSHQEAEEERRCGAWEKVQQLLEDSDVAKEA